MRSPCSLALAACAALLAGVAPAQAQPRKLAAIAVPLEAGLEGEALLASAVLESTGDAHAAVVPLLDKARGGADARKAKGAEAARLLPAAGDALDGMEFAKAVAKAREALALLEGADLRESMPALLDAMALEALALLASNKKLDAKTAFNKLFTLKPDYKVSPARLTPDAAKLCDEVKAKMRARAKGSLKVETSVPALVWIDGAPRGPSPVTANDLVAGSHYVTAVAYGYATAQDKGFAGPGGAASLNLVPLAQGAQLVSLAQAARDALVAGSGEEASAGALARWAEADEAVVVGLRAAGTGLAAVAVRADARGRALGTAEKALAGRGEAARPGLEAALRELVAVEAAQKRPPDVAKAGGNAAPPEATTTAVQVEGGGNAKWVAGWVMIGAAAVSAGVGVGVGVNVAGLASQARKTPQVDTARYDQLVNDGKTQGWIADSLYGVAVLAAVTGTVLLLTSGSGASGSAADAPQASATIAPLPGGAALAVQGSF